MKLKILPTVSTAAIIITSALVAPQVFARGPGHMFDEVDANKDGKITRAEAHELVLKHFRAADANKDKVLTQAEAKTHHEAKRKERGNPEAFVEARFKAHDTNNDGKIERSESKLPDKIFARIDSNSDGSITKAEALEAHKNRMANSSKRHGHHGSKDHEKRGKSHEGAKKDRRGHASPFDRVDTSGDGKIVEAEAKGAADRIFSRIDQNNDNVITRAEVQQMKKHDPKRPGGKGHDKKQK